MTANGLKALTIIIHFKRQSSDERVETLLKKKKKILSK